MKDIHQWRRVIVLWKLILMGGLLVYVVPACIQDVSLEGRPCKEDADCLFQHTCSEDGFCGGKQEWSIVDAGKEAAKEAAPEPTKESVKEERQGIDAGPEKEPIQEVAKEEPPEESTGSRQLHLPCDWHADAAPAEKCASGLRCVRLSKETSICLQDCTSNPAICGANKDGRTICRIDKWEGNDIFQVCVKEVEVGESCNHEQSVYCKVSPAGASYCEKGKCVKAIVGSAGGQCGKALAPPVICDHKLGFVCDQVSRCTKGTRAYTGETCSSTLLCGIPDRCINFGDLGQRVCMRTCSGNQDCPQNANPPFTCYGQAGSLQICLQTGCKSGLQCVYQKTPYFQCNSFPNVVGDACIPYDTSATVEFGQPCLRSKNLRCKPPNICVLTAAGFDGLCVPECQDDSDCKKVHPNATCLSRQNGGGYGFCGWRCTTTAACPFGHTCRDGLCGARPS
ncbi:MAG TPA: hypothetical protein DCE42_23060 [Myxococcales bacterium]|nr:hypothetical protein [Myxococcales bacterium]